MKKTILYIMGVGHSGSTLLQLLLSSHSEMVGIGEIGQLIKKINARRPVNDFPDCSCGLSATNCDFWGDILKSDVDYDENKILFNVIHSRFDDIFPNKILIDNTKTLDDFKKYYKDAKNEGLEVKILFIFRDFRGWIISNKKRNKRKNRKNYGILYDSYKWFYRNLRKYIFLKNSNLDFFMVSYEDLVFNTNSVVHNITKFIGIENEKLDLKKSMCHDIFGNRMKNDPNMKDNIKYNHEWMRDIKTILLSPLLVFPYLLNYKLYNGK